MANQEHVDILMQGVEAWNKWREDNPEIKPDLSWHTLRVEDVRDEMLLDFNEKKKIDLRRINFSQARMSKATFENAFIENADFEGSFLVGAGFNGCILYGVKLIGADMDSAKFVKSSLVGANVKGANLNNAYLDKTGLGFLKYDRKTKCRGIQFDTCYGSQMFKTFARDQNFLGEYREKYPFFYWLWLIFADCGRSFWPLVLWSLGLAVLFALIFMSCPSWAPDWWRDLCVEYGPRFEQTPTAYAGQPLGFWSAAYFSIVTFTTLGFGDVVAANPMARFLVGVEVVLGYIMLGGLISILANKLARRA